MKKLSRRRFVGQASAAAVSSLVPVPIVAEAAVKSDAATPASLPFPAAIPGKWRSFGRLLFQTTADTVTLQDGFAVDDGSWADCEFSFRARAPQNVEQVQIWAGFRCRDRDSRYVFALRGGDNDDVYLARYGSDGGAKFLGVAPLDYHPEPGKWHALRAVVRGSRIQIFVDDETTPRINVVDAGALWSAGGMALGGGWLPVEFRDVSVRALTTGDIAAFDTLGETTHLGPGRDKAMARGAERSVYAALKIDRIESPRVEISLDGKWLFLPEQELTSTEAPSTLDFDDKSWHVMDVPNFWTPTLSWLHAETGFNYLKGNSTSKGVCDKVLNAEMRRLEAYTFPWKETKSAWYRHHIELPADLGQSRFALCFEAIAKVSEVWVNGKKVGSHVGMFGEVQCDVTAALRPGPNVIAVHVVGHQNRAPIGNQVLGVAVTVEVTAAMLNSLPHGMYPDDAAGIWQPVTLVVTQPVSIEDIYIKPSLDGLDCELTIHEMNVSAAGPIAVSYVIRSKADGSTLHASTAGSPESPGAEGKLHFSTPPLKPKLWSPHDPNLYTLEVILTSHGVVADRRTETFGFRTFSTDGARLMLNGKPYWLRGGDHFPNALRPNDRALAMKFMQMAREGNVMATRSHTSPFTKTWLDAADECGMAVSYEGTWPWLMLRGEPPADDLLKAWKAEFASLIRQHRNHPSLILWTVNNEMKFPGTDRSNLDLVTRKWDILTDMMKTIRAIDPTRPVVCDSSYVRNEVAKEYATLIKPSGFDDGDIDDVHSYPGWYNPTAFHFFGENEFTHNRSTPGRPLISQELSTGYPRNDDGHPCRFYLFQHHTPQALVGDEAYENRDPALFLKRQAFLTKELAEVIRRSNRDTCAGVLHFAYVTWFKDVWNADTIEPFETYYALKRALQQVMVSAELRGRHFYAGTSAKFQVCVANDSEDGSDLLASRLTWRIRQKEKTIATGSADVPGIAHYSNHWLEMDLVIPANLPSPRIDAVLELRLEHGGVLMSENEYDIVLATGEWAGIRTVKSSTLSVFDPSGKAPAGLRRAGVVKIDSLANLRTVSHLVVVDADIALRDPANAAALKEFTRTGGKILLLNPGGTLPTLFPDHVASYRTCAGEIVSMHIPESPAFSGIQPLDLSWFELGEGNVPRACRGVYRVDPARVGVTALASVVDIHGYLQKADDILKVSGTPLIELRVGDGLVIASEMMLEATDNDPIAGRLLWNLLGMLTSS